jgi:hypothetical protein
MTKEHQRLFTEVDPPEGISLRITDEITRLRIRAARLRLALMGTTTVAALAALFPTTIALRNEFTNSGANDYLSLLWTDADIVVLHFQEFALSLTEVLPLSGITLLLSICIVLLWAASSSASA